MKKQKWEQERKYVFNFQNNIDFQSPVELFLNNYDIGKRKPYVSKQFPQYQNEAKNIKYNIVKTTWKGGGRRYQEELC